MNENANAVAPDTIDPNADMNDTDPEPADGASMVWQGVTFYWVRSWGRWVSFPGRDEA